MNDMLTFEFIYSFHMLPFMFVARFVCFNPKKSYSLMNIEKRCTSYFIPSFMGAVLIVILQNEISLMEVYLL